MTDVAFNVLMSFQFCIWALQFCHKHIMFAVYTYPFGVDQGQSSSKRIVLAISLFLTTRGTKVCLNNIQWILSWFCVLHLSDNTRWNACPTGAVRNRFNVGANNTNLSWFVSRGLHLSNSSNHFEEPEAETTLPLCSEIMSLVSMDRVEIILTRIVPWK